MPSHTYRLTNRWTGNLGSGTSGYKAYGRDHEISIAGKPALLASSDPHYRGDPSRHNPEDLLLAAISGCHLLWYLHFCSDSQIIVVSYQDEAEAVMETAADGNGRFTKAVLRPHVTITSTNKVQLAEHLHESPSEETRRLLDAIAATATHTRPVVAPSVPPAGPPAPRCTRGC